jgi:hypothetical protein
MKKLYLLACLVALASLQLNAQAPRKVLLEDYTGTWCGYCPDGTTIMNTIVGNYPNVIGAALHNGDGMANAYSNAIDIGLNITAYPNGSIDRFKFPSEAKVGVSRSKWTTYCAQRLNVTSPCNLGIISTFNATTRVVNVTVNVGFVAAATAPAGGDLRLSCVLMEDGITGYPQSNYMGQTCSSPNPSSAWYTYPCTISNFVHDHTARYNMAGDQWGDNTVIPASVSAGQTFSKSFSYTLPSNWNANNMKVLAFVSRHHPSDAFQRDLLNANETTSLIGVVGIEEDPAAALVSTHGVYPNPISDLGSVMFQLNRADDVKVSVYNALGQYVATLIDRNLTPGQHVFYWDASEAANGLYFYEIRTTESVTTGKMLVSH